MMSLKTILLITTFLIFLGLTCKINTIKLENLGCEFKYQNQCQNNNIILQQCKFYNPSNIQSNSFKCVQQCCNSNLPQFSQKIVNQCITNQNKKKPLNVGELVGIIIGCCLGGVCIITICILWVKNYKVNVQKNVKWIKAESVQTPSSSICLLCSKLGPILVTNCNHIFHTDCFLKYLVGNDNCPVCKSRGYNPTKIFCQGCRIKYLSLYVNDKTLIEQIKQTYGKKCEQCLLLSESGQSAQTFSVDNLNNQKLEI